MSKVVRESLIDKIQIAGFFAALGESTEGMRMHQSPGILDLY